MTPDLNRHWERLINYSHRFSLPEPEHQAALDLKRYHSRQVLTAAQALVQQELTATPESTRRSALLGAIYHDIGRFPQYAQYRTFADPVSVNHGRLGLITLKTEGFLSDESPSVAQATQTAVSLHNRHLIPPNLPPHYLIPLQVVRDADKIDIYRVLAEHLTPKPQPTYAVMPGRNPDPNGYNPKILADLEAGHSGRYEDMIYHNDFRLLVLSWLFELNFPTSLQLIRQDGHAHTILSTLPHLPPLAPIRHRLTRMLEE